MADSTTDSGATGAVVTLEHVLARFAPRPSIWAFYPSREAAERAAPAVNAREANGHPYAPMTWDEYRAGERAHYVTGELIEITEDQWWAALEVLPPVQWEHRDGVERFMAMERLTGSITAAYARFGGRYFTRHVDALDKSTWITGEEIARHIARAGATAKTEG